LAFLSAVALAIVVAVSGRMFGSGDARPVTLYMSAAASVLSLLVCEVSGGFAFPQTNAGWISFAAVPVFHGFAITRCARRFFRILTLWYLRFSELSFSARP
jgi:hypothetical protein